MLKIDDIRRANAGLGYLNIRIVRNSLNVRCSKRGINIDRCPYPATPEGLKATIALCKEIEADIYRDKFDATLAKYGLCRAPKKQLAAQPETPKTYTILDAWHDYKLVKSPTIAMSTRVSKWATIDKMLNSIPQPLTEISRTVDMLLYLRGNYSDGTIYNLVPVLSAAVNFAIECEKYTGKNPFPKARKIFRVPTKEVKVFTTADVAVILDAFKNEDKGSGGAYYSLSYFYHFVAFRFLTGCRPSEALALTWDDITTDATGKMFITINKRYVEKTLSLGTKNGKGKRVLPCSPLLQRLITEIPRRHNTLVFPSFSGGYLSLNNFTDNYWRPTIRQLHREGKISCYAPFYDIRHTFGTHAVRDGIDLKTLAHYMGNTPEVLLQHYVEVDKDIQTPTYDL